EKKPERRFHSAHDLGFALEALSMPSGSRLETTTALPAMPESIPGSDWLRNARVAWIAAGLLLIGLLVLLPFTTGYFRRAPAEAIAVRFALALPGKALTFGPAVSPDGRNLAINAVIGGRPQIWLRPLGSFTSRPLPGTEGTFGCPFWSPDSLSIGFLAEGKLKKMNVADGTQQTLCNVPGTGGAFGGTWNREGVILFTRSGIIYQVSATGGEPAPVPGVDQSRQGTDYRWPYFLPDGRHFLYLAGTPQQSASEVYLAALGEKEAKRLLTADSNAIYSASSPVASGASGGYLLFGREGALLAQPFDARHLTLVGEPFRVADHVKANFRNSRGDFSVSDTGTLVYDPSGASENQQLAWFDRTGRPLESVGAPGTFQFPVLSRDEKRVALEQRDPKTGTPDIYVKDLVRDTTSRLTFDPASDWFVVWSPDGSRIAWASSRGGSHQIYQKLASGAGQEELLLQSNSRVTPTDWSANGRSILYEQLNPKTNENDLWVLLLDDRKPVPFLQTPFDEASARFSPDGRWIAYVSNESGNREVYVQTFPASGGRWPISAKGGDSPRWRRDGKEIFYVDPDAKVMAVEVKTGSAFEAGIPKVLFDVGALRSTFRGGYAVTADGQRFLFVSRGEETDPSLAVVVNWTVELKR
ncbi:MAG: hypothetical protein ABI882_16170, partial [Acidobacteriota bacterium]